MQDFTFSNTANDNMNMEKSKLCRCYNACYIQARAGGICPLECNYFSYNIKIPSQESNVIDKDKFIKWISGKRYLTVDSSSTTMTEEYEKKHQWELSRNCLIDTIIDKLESGFFYIKIN